VHIEHPSNSILFSSLRSSIQKLYFCYVSLFWNQPRTLLACPHPAEEQTIHAFAMPAAAPTSSRGPRELKALRFHGGPEFAPGSRTNFVSDPGEQDSIVVAGPGTDSAPELNPIGRESKSELSQQQPWSESGDSRQGKGGEKRRSIPQLCQFHFNSELLVMAWVPVLFPWLKCPRLLCVDTSSRREAEPLCLSSPDTTTLFFNTRYIEAEVVNLWAASWACQEL